MGRISLQMKNTAVILFGKGVKQIFVVRRNLNFTSFFEYENTLPADNAHSKRCG